MEHAEGIIDSVKKWLKLKRTPSRLTPEPPPPVPGWDYAVFREYILALTKSRESLLNIEEYPSRIDLSKPWQELFNLMRANPNEGWALLGYQAGQRRLILPTIAEEGLSHSIPAEVVAVGLEKARIKTGITDLIGDIHNHPRRSTALCWQIPSGITSKGDCTFSLGDLYSLLNALKKQRPSDPKESMRFVVEGNETLAVFATRRSLDLVRNNFSETYEQFAKKWYAKYGWNYKGAESRVQGGGELAEPTRPDAPHPWQINKGIAFHYQLALYRGFRDKPLLREHPARNGP